MFLKPFKIKNNVQLKASDGKKLRNKILKYFPNATDAELGLILGNKSSINFVKIITHAGSTCAVYTVEKRPIFFEDESEELIPTVYCLWLVPTLVPYFTTHAAVLPKLANGADLMLPGVIRIGSGLGSYGNYKKDKIVAVNLTSNKAAVGVGRLARSSEDLYMSGGHGPCVKLLHVFGDKLWGIEPSVTMQLPQQEAVMEVPKEDDFPSLGSTIKSKRRPDENVNQIEDVVQEVPLCQIEDLLINSNEDNERNSDEIVEEIEIQSISEPDSMDTVLKNAFLTALKMDGKNLELPLLTSNFYRLHVLPNAGKQIDLKQTSYKKFSKFLNEMADAGFLVVREETKGVEKIISIDFEHPHLINFIPSHTNNKTTGGAQAQLFHVAMTELYIITDESVPFFGKLSFKKGDGIASTQVKKILKEYISKNKLPYVGVSKEIQLDTTLKTICGKESALFEEIYQTLLNRMHHTYEMRGKNELSSNRPPIQMTLATRSGNKKVTLVSNLEAYGIIISEFAKACKVGAAASTSIVKVPTQKQEVLQVQGNQVRFIHNLLIETYKIPPKQIQGLDLAKKEKKKK